MNLRILSFAIGFGLSCVSVYFSGLLDRHGKPSETRVPAPLLPAPSQERLPLRGKRSFLQIVGELDYNQSLARASNLAPDLASLPTDLIAESLSKMPTLEEERVFWFATLKYLALTDLDEAIQLSKRAPTKIYSERHVVNSIIEAESLPGFYRLLDYDIAPNALLSGLGSVVNSEPAAEIKAAIESLSKRSIDSMNGSMDDFVEAIDWINISDPLLVANIFDDSLWPSPAQSDLRALLDGLGQSQLPKDSVDDLLVRLSGGNSMLIAKLSGNKSAELSQDSGQQARSMFPKKSGAYSKTHWERLLDSYADGVALRRDGTNPLSWVEKSVVDEDDQRTAIRAIVGRRIFSEKSDLLQSEIENFAARSPGSRLLEIVNDELARSDAKINVAE